MRRGWSGRTCDRAALRPAAEETGQAFEQHEEDRDHCRVPMACSLVRIDPPAPHVLSLCGGSGRAPGRVSSLGSCHRNEPPVTLKMLLVGKVNLISPHGVCNPVGRPKGRAAPLPFGNPIAKVPAARLRGINLKDLRDAKKRRVGKLCRDEQNRLDSFPTSNDLALTTMGDPRKRMNQYSHSKQRRSTRSDRRCF